VGIEMCRGSRDNSGVGVEMCRCSRDNSGVGVEEVETTAVLV
jgi:hypothetical protein